MWCTKAFFVLSNVAHLVLLSSKEVHSFELINPWNIMTNSIDYVKNGVSDVATGVKHNIDNDIENIKNSQPAQFMNDQIGVIQNSQPAQFIGNQIETVQNSQPAQLIGNQIEAAQNFEHIKYVGDQMQNVYNDLNPSALLEKITIPLPNISAIRENAVNLVQTTAVFSRFNATLNCFGIPLGADIINKLLERIFIQTTRAEDVKFYIYTRRNSVSMHAKDPFNFRDFDVRRPTVLMVHGFMSSGRESWLHDMKNAYLKLRDVNAIIVDWQQGSNTWNYYSAAVSTRIVGLEIAKLFAKIRDVYGNDVDINGWSSIHFVGHSLGSHISAHAAHLIKESQKGQSQRWIVRRITGLDPAQPCFGDAEESLKLDKTDAAFVDVIHTNARNLLLLGLGLPDQLGHVDFFPNGGRAQPGCSDIDASIWNFPIVLLDIIKESVCSHGRSHTFFTESILDMAAKNCTFYAFRWDRTIRNDNKSLLQECMIHDCTAMGEISANFSASGIFYAPTKNTAPYCGIDTNSPMPPQDPELPKLNLFTSIAKLFPWKRY